MLERHGPSGDLGPKEGCDGIQMSLTAEGQVEHQVTRIEFQRDSDVLNKGRGQMGDMALKNAELWYGAGAETLLKTTGAFIK